MPNQPTISEAELRKHFPGASASTLRANHAGGEIQRPVSQQAIRHEPLATPPGTQEGPRRRVVFITGYRLRLLDPDNFAGGCKYLVDGLRYAHLISDDTTDHIELRTRQVQVRQKKDECTVITIYENT